MGDIGTQTFVIERLILKTLRTPPTVLYAMHIQIASVHTYTQLRRVTIQIVVAQNYQFSRDYSLGSNAPCFVCR